jgi:hypothetical protein
MSAVRDIIEPVGVTPLYQSTPAQTLQADRLRFPGMLPREVLIFRNWLGTHESEYDSFDYNARVGAGFDPGAGWDESIRAMAIANSQKRLDVVGWKGTQATLIEVKDRAGASALGQLLTYAPLWSTAHQDLPRANMRLVTNRLQPDIGVVASYWGIAVDVVATDFSILARDRRAAPFISKLTVGVRYF